MAVTAIGAEDLGIRSKPEPAMQVQARSLPALPVLPMPIGVSAPPAPPLPEPGGCGWFDSSHELRAGLTVTEDGDDLLFQLWSQAQRSLH